MVHLLVAPDLLYLRDLEMQVTANGSKVTSGPALVCRGERASASWPAVRVSSLHEISTDIGPKAIPIGKNLGRTERRGYHCE
jgi:hypothetical protein